MKDYKFTCWADIVLALKGLDAERHELYSRFKPVSENHVFDEEQSVKWNRQKVAEYNKDVVNIKKQALEDLNARAEDCKQQILTYIEKECECSHEQAVVIHDRLYTEDVVYDSECANDILYFCYKLLNAAS